MIFNIYFLSLQNLKLKFDEYLEYDMKKLCKIYNLVAIIKKLIA